MEKTDSMPVLEVENLKKYYPVRKGFFQKTINHVKAVDGVSFRLNAGETLGLVGESGCGKTTVGRSILRLTQPTGGKVFFKGKDLGKMDKETLRKTRTSLQIIFQDPFSSLNPRMNVGQIIAEPIKNYETLSRHDIMQRVAELMNRVGLRPAQMGRYPHEFSGGQRQRIGIARALAVKPDVIICDEAVSALDVSIQAQIINLLKDLQEEMNLAYLFIAHDLSVVEYISHRVAVMYLGRIVELAPDRNLYKNPLHPYTKALLSAVPIPDPLVNPEQEIVLSGDVPSPLDPPEGCTFHPRCPMSMNKCRTRPVYREIEPDHWIACHLYP
ncbi:MAG: peptide ABC transporter substrate-binding protein [Deltaproteobacteria bacterium]|nr:MAG: peptide ABC transporter substrate-binding protein [Deltaproteobacteria bacterium]